MHFIDTHIHLQDYKGNCATDIIRAAAAAGVVKFVCVSAQESDWRKVTALYEQFPDTLIPALGIHPWYAADVQNGWEQRLSQYLKNYPQALIGECGLDRLHCLEAQPQKAVFEAQLNIAKELKRPLLIHAVKAQDWLEDYWHKMPVPFVFHSYNGKAELLKKIIAHGGYAAFNSSILRNKGIAALLDVLPKDKILYESDGPYQFSPLDIPMLNQNLAELGGEDTLILSARIYQNTMEFINAGKK